MHRKLELKNFLVFRNVLKICNFDKSEIFQHEDEHHSEYVNGDGETSDMESFKTMLEEHLLSLCPETIIDKVMKVINDAEFRE